MGKTLRGVLAVGVLAGGLLYPLKIDAQQPPRPSDSEFIVHPSLRISAYTVDDPEFKDNIEYFKRVLDSNNSGIKSIGESLYGSSLQALHLAGCQGGYTASEPKNFMELEDKKGNKFKVPVYYSVGRFSKPELKDIETEFGEYVGRETLKSLESKINSFEMMDESKIRTAVKIKKGRVEISHSVSLKLRSPLNNNVYPLNVRVPKIPYASQLFEMYELASYVTDSHREDPDMIDISTLSDMADERKLGVRMVSGGEAGIIVMISPFVKTSSVFRRFDKIPSFEGSKPTSVFLFANQYSKKEDNRVKNSIGLPKVFAPNASESKRKSIAPSAPRGIVPGGTRQSKQKPAPVPPRVKK